MLITIQAAARPREILLHTHITPRAPQRIRNELRFRHISVVSKSLIAEAFWRITFTGEDLAGFHSPSFDDHIKVFFAAEAGALSVLPQMTDEGIVWPGGVRPVARDYTPLAFNGRDALTLDFWRHDGGIASGWAEQAAVGDRLVIGGPRGSCVAPVDYAWQLYVCDETGLPAVKRRLAEIQAQHVHLFAFADADVGAAYLGDLDGVTVSWLGSSARQADNLQLLWDQLAALPLPETEYFIWLTGEGEGVKRLSDYFIQQRGAHPDVVRAVAYWHRK